MLQRTKEAVLDSLKKNEDPSRLSGSEFEQIVYDKIVDVAKETPFDGKLIHTADREFPDIVAAGYFGIEVKATKKDDWTSIGNSVLESSRKDGIEKIYLFFGKLGGIPDIKFRKYEECLKGIAVTHYPRYQIDMNLGEDQSIFNKMKTDYDSIRASKNPIKEIRKYYRDRLREGEALWWIDDDLDRTATVSPVIKRYSSLDLNTKASIKADLFVHFPIVLSSSTRKYEQIPAYLAARYGVVSGAVRDYFSAGGQEDMEFEDKVFRVPQIIAEMCRHAAFIKEHLRSTSIESLSTTWQKHVTAQSTAIEAWLNEIDRQSSHMNLPVSASKLFIASSKEWKTEAR